MKIRNKVSLILFFALLIAGPLAAKKVKFMVNMSGLVKNSFGIHITGDFQTLAGYAGGDWNSATTEMFQEPSDTNIYSVVVDIPAHRKYEFKFVNGIQFYEVEFVPLVSRVGYNFNDNRWIYIDSLAADTTVIGPLIFSGNAPAGQRAFRMLVDMSQAGGISADSVHVAGSFQGWDPATTMMYSFGSYVYEYIAYVDTLSPTADYRFYNGNTSGSGEVIVGSCATNSQRSITVSVDSLMPVVCFAGCAACAPVSVAQAWEPRLEVYPNPATEAATVRMSNHFGDWELRLLDAQGRQLRTWTGAGEQALRLPREGMAAGLYYVQTLTADGGQYTQKLVFR